MLVKKVHVDPQTGESTSGDGSKEMLMVSGVSRNHRGQVQLSLLRFDRRSRLQSFLLHAVHNTLEAYRITQRLGLPADSIYRKLPHLERSPKAAPPRLRPARWMLSFIAPPPAVSTACIMGCGLLHTAATTMYCGSHVIRHEVLSVAVVPCCCSIQREERSYLRVHLQPGMTAALATVEKGHVREKDRDRVARPKPRFKTHPPGLVEVVVANIGLIWACANIKF